MNRRYLYIEERRKRKYLSVGLGFAVKEDLKALRLKLSRALKIDGVMELDASNPDEVADFLDTVIGKLTRLRQDISHSR